MFSKSVSRNKGRFWVLEYIEKSLEIFYIERAQNFVMLNEDDEERGRKTVITYFGLTTTR